MRSRGLLATLLAVARIQASENVFSVHDDVLAFPQYDITFSESYITHESARKKLKGSDLHKDPIKSWEGDVEGQIARFHSADKNNEPSNKNDDDKCEYMLMTKGGSDYLCAIPRPEEIPPNITEPVEEEKPKTDLATAADRGWRLLQDMEGKPCLYFSTGWWSYSFCYNGEVTQFHALPPGVNGARLWPPTEDPSTPSYVLGKYEAKTVDEKEKENSAESSSKQEAGELQTKAETNYLVRKLAGGTSCDLTGKPRKIEVQFHCHPQSTDRIGWIKETSTCAYMMIIYTPRLCNDVAFLPPKAAHVHRIACQEILQPDQVSDWEARKSHEASLKMIGQGGSEKPRVMIGGVEVGGQKWVGGDGKRIERGRIVLTAEERAEIIIMQKDGQIHELSRAEMKKLNLNPDEIANFQEQMQEAAGSTDWKIVRIDEPNGQVQLRGIVGSNEGKKLTGKANRADEDSTQAGDNDGSEEEYKEEI